MDDHFDHGDESKRRTRNLSEKKRRDQFNSLVTELCTMICANSKKMDKSSVLKSTISFLKTHNETALRAREHEIKEDWKPSFLSNEEFTYLMLEAVEGFTMAFSLSGRIYYVSDGITSLLGHLPSNIINNSIFNLTHEDDYSNLHELLQNPVSVLGPMQHVVRNENEVKFLCLMKRALGEDPTYELMQFAGYFRLNDENLVEVENNGFIHSHPDSNRMLFVCTGRLHTPQLIRDVSCLDSTQNEFTSRHSLAWKYLFLDQRASQIIGYLPFEVLGTSGYDYYHFDDLEKIANCHEALMQKGVLTSCYYRFLTKGQQWIWLQSRFYITYHQWSSKPEFIVCTHRVISYSDICKNTIQNNKNIYPYRAISQQASMNSATGIDDPNNAMLAPSVSANSWMPITQPTYYLRGTARISVSNDNPNKDSSSQEKSHDKNENLHEVIARQEEELRRVKKQLMYASLGILPPVINEPDEYMPALPDIEKPQHNMQCLPNQQNFMEQ